MSFEKLLTPNSVAVVGASANPDKVGYAVLNNIITGGYKGALYPVNPKADEILGKKCYKTLSEIPGEIDSVVVVVKRDQVVPIMAECADKAIKAVIIITAGFAETGEEGKKLQREITEIARRADMTVLGPNCLGVINPFFRLNASFGQPMGEPGPIAFMSQSGALITAVQDIAASSRIGFSLLVSMGNKAAFDEVQLLENLRYDGNTKVIAAYLEDISRGQDFMRVAERVGKQKPIVILKAGRTQAGARAASSHTGSLAGADAAYDSAFERTGVIRVDSVEHLFDVSTALASQPLPAGDRIAIVTNAGGPGIMMTDALEMAGLTVAKLDDETIAKLRGLLPEAAAVRNPVDVLGDAKGERYGSAMEILLASPAIDGLVVILTPQKMTDDVGTAREIVRVSKQFNKPVLTCFMGANIVAGGVAILRENKIPQYGIPERTAKTMKEMVDYARYKARRLRMVERFAVNRNPVIKLLRSYRNRNTHEIGEFDSKAILKAYNFDVPRGILATSVPEAVRFAAEAGFPLAMKISSPDILHKSDVGGVRIGLTNTAAVEDAFELMMLRIRRKLPDAEIRGVLLEKMAMAGREVILGMKRDPQFGPMLMFGLGGIFVEVLKDVTFGLAPVTAAECLKMMESVKTYRLLKGARGEKPVDMDAIVLNLQRLSQLVMDFPEIEEVDINPLKVGQEGDGALVVDARIILAKEPE
ncbi:MAG TPA: acetate--CoA ligase family protein [Chitinivibrionales bacterium]|nr:acetate--CoA ligase family protein [Chitinivibrionales bacterium]